MSRHKLIKNLDLDDELDEFDGGEDYDNGAGGEGLSMSSSPLGIANNLCRA
jgi:elongation factor 1 alpha-like protein